MKLISKCILFSTTVFLSFTLFAAQGTIIIKNQSCVRGLGGDEQEVKVHVYRIGSYDALIQHPNRSATTKPTSCGNVEGVSFTGGTPARKSWVIIPKGKQVTAKIDMHSANDCNKWAVEAEGVTAGGYRFADGDTVTCKQDGLVCRCN